MPGGHARHASRLKSVTGTKQARSRVTETCASISGELGESYLPVEMRDNVKGDPLGVNFVDAMLPESWKS